MILSACGSSDGDGSADPTSSVTTDAVEADTTASTEVSDEAEPEEADAADLEEAGAGLFPEIELGPTEPGPRPTLSWSDVDGATLYQLTVLDADGVPYWSWSGAETEVPLGGMENPDAIGAWVFEELTWMVVARDDAGSPVGMSSRGVLQP